MSTKPLTKLDHYRAEFQTREDARVEFEPIWLNERRRADLERFMALGFPSAKQESWKYNKPDFLAAQSWRSGGNGLGRANAWSALEFPGLAAQHLIFLDGRFQPHLSDSTALAAGVTVASLSGSWSEPGAERLGSLADGEDPLTALNTAFFDDGVYLHLPADLRLDRPIHLIFLSSGAEPGVFANLRNLVVAEPGSTATLIETYASLGDEAGWSNAVTEVHVGAGAEIQHIKLQRENAASFHVGTSAVRQEADSRYRSWEISLGGAMVRQEIHLELAGEAARCDLYGLYIGHDEQRLDHRTRVTHAVPNCRTEELYKGILDDRSLGIFEGRILVQPGAQRTDAVQASRNLLLSDDAVANSMPQLEIYADDVRCTHGSTTGHLDENQLFYLRTRGFSTEAARSLLIYAFASEVLDSLDWEPLRKELRSEVLDLLPRGELIEGVQ